MITESQLHEAEMSHNNTAYQLEQQEHKLAQLEAQLSADALDLDELTKRIQRKREQVASLRASAELARHRCLEMKATLEKQETVDFAATT